VVVWDGARVVEVPPKTVAVSEEQLAGPKPSLDGRNRPDQTWFMKTVNIQEAKTHLSRLVQEAAEGEDIVIAKAGKPMVRLTPVSTLEGPRRLGALAGRVVEAEDCWARDAAIEEMFYGSPVEPGAT
jgi:prevent-host-death family protein